MKKPLLVVCLLCWSLFAPAQEFFTRTDIAVDNCYSPVGIGIDGGFLYVSSMGPTYHKTSDGCIIRHNLATGEEEPLFQHLINSPKSLVIFDDTILFIDPYMDKESGKPSLVLADLAAGRILASIGLDAGYPFDIVRVGDNRFALSDSRNERLYTVTLDGGTLAAEVWVENVPGAKGLEVFDGGVYVAGSAADADDPEKKSGMIYRVDIASGETTPYQAVDTPRPLNAIAFRNGYLFVGDWGSKRQETISLYVYHVPGPEYVAEGKDIPPGSDFQFDGDALYLSDMTGNRVVRLDIDFNALDALRAERGK